MHFILFIFIFLFTQNSHANDKQLDFKKRIYELVKIQYYKDSSSNENYFSTKNNKSLAACLDWDSLSDLYNNNKKKYYKEILWGSSLGNNFSKKEAIQNCQLRAKNKKNCVCQIIDYQNINSIVFPEYILSKLNIKNNDIKKENQTIASINTEQENKLLELKKLLESKLINNDDYNKKRNEILGLETSNEINIQTANKDLIGPEINVPKLFTSDEDLTALIEGSVFDESEIAYVVIDGDPVSLNKNKFTHKLFVKPGGQEVLITAMDKFGNKSNASIKLNRPKIIVKTKKFDDLNPTIIKVKINPSAVAIIIGIEEYQSTFAALFAKNDALAFNDFVNTSFGVPQQNIKLLTDNQAGRTNTLKALSKWLPKMVKEDETDVYIFFSGHGLASENGEDLYLLPSDGDPDLLEESTLLRNKLFDRIAKLKPRSVTVFLDTCYSGATRTEEFLIAARPIFIEPKEQDIPDNFTVFSASAGRETAKVLEEAEHGLFSYYMMKGLEGEADANSDNQITNGELFTFINRNVTRQANQTPQLNGNPEEILVKW